MFLKISAYDEPLTSFELCIFQYGNNVEILSGPGSAQPGNLGRLKPFIFKFLKQTRSLTQLMSAFKPETLATISCWNIF